MKLLLSVAIILSLSACGIPKNMDNISANMVNLNKRIDNMASNINGMNGAIGNVSNGIHMQSLSIMLNEMLKPENTKYITLTSVNTIPMIASAKGFAETASQEELSGLTFLWINEINQAQVTDVLTKEQKDNYDLGKWIKLNALQMIAGFIPDKTINEMIKAQIEEGGAYETAAYQLLLLRSMFIQSFLVDQAMSIPMTNPTQYRGVLKYLEQLGTIANLPYKKSMTIKLFGFYDTDNNGLNQTIDMQDVDMCSYYTKLKAKYEKELDKKYLTLNLNDITIKLERGCK